jgi:dTDP-4-amino-4,6-dideoxygalactose transaminase
MLTYKRYFNKDFLTKQENHQFEQIFEGANLVWTSSGRGSLELTIRLLHLEPDDIVLIPAFVAHGVILPLIRKKIRYYFYKSDHQLIPDINDIRKLMSKYSVKAIIVIHYFGYPQEIEPLLSLRKEFSFYIIEDCAQAFLSSYHDGSMIGTKGDLSIFSIPKSIPVPDGSFIIINNPEINTSDIAYRHSVLHEISVIFHLMFLNVKTLQIRINIKFFNVFFRTFSKLLYFAYYRLICMHSNPIMISKRTLKIINHFELNKFREKRQENIKTIRNLFSESSSYNGRFFNVENIVAIGFPIVCKNRDEIINKLLKAEIEILSYKKYWDFIPKDQLSVFKNEVYFGENHLIIPVSENIQQSELNNIVSVIKSLGICE